ncbi:hypothetical protein [Enhygromyxa salina]|nr:hypothetical protein [Enhygromyxa salina]
MSVPATAPVSGPALTQPAALPEIPAEPPAPTAAVPPGTPKVEGWISDMVAIDEDRAIVRFLVPGPDHEKQWWIALMRRDGSLAWVQSLSGQLAANEGVTGIEIIQDAVSVMTATFVGDDPELELHGFALADGARRFEIAHGQGFAQGVANDGGRRFDLRVHYPASLGVRPTAELVATSSTKELWRASIPISPAPGPDPTLVDDSLAVRVESKDDDHASWWVFERSSGKVRGKLQARVQSCSDGTRWFVRSDDGLLSVDPKTVATRDAVPAALQAADLVGTWMLDDCAVIPGAVVVLASRGYRKAMVAFDLETFAPLGHVELGAVYVGSNGFDPMPARMHAKAAFPVMTHDGGREIMVIDPVAGQLLERWGANDHGAIGYAFMDWSGGYLASTTHTLAVVDTRSGSLAGLATVPEGVFPGSQQLVGSTLWLPPTAPLRLGARAPRLIDLSAAASEDLRGAVLFDVHPIAPSPVRGRAQCPDPTAPLTGPGTGSDGTLGPVAQSRLPTWDLDILHEAARMHACAPGLAPSLLLAWYVMEDDRPLRNDYALVLVEDTSHGPPTFTIVQASRHANNREWNVGTSPHSNREVVRSFDHRPTRREIDAFLAQSDWHFDHDWGRVLAGNVLDAEWRAATGQSPWRSFPKGIERPD